MKLRMKMVVDNPARWLEDPSASGILEMSLMVCGTYMTVDAERVPGTRAGSQEI